MKINKSGRLLGAEDICMNLHSDLMVDVVFGEKQSVSMKFSGRNFNELCKISNVDMNLVDKLILLVKTREDLDFLKYHLNSQSTIKNYEDKLENLLNILFSYDVYLYDEESYENFYLETKLNLSEEYFLKIADEVSNFYYILEELISYLPSKFICGDFVISDNLIYLKETPMLRIEGVLLEDLKKQVFEHMNEDGKKVIEFQERDVLERLKAFEEFKNKLKNFMDQQFDYNDVKNLDLLISLIIDINKSFKFYNC